METPLINSWTEFGTLEYVCVGTAIGASYAESYLPKDAYKHNVVRDTRVAGYINQLIGPRPMQRILKAEKELETLRDLLESESITVTSVSEYDEDIQLEMKRQRSNIDQESPKLSEDDQRVRKQKIQVCRPPEDRYDRLLMTPWFTNYYQFGLACPRDTVITFGNTVVECATASKARYFESYFCRDIVYKYWKADPRIGWKTAPKPTCKDSLYLDTDDKRAFGHLTEEEVVFDAADISRIGKDVFYKKSESANYAGMEWLRREFPELRFHAVHFPNDHSFHIDINLVPLCPPTAGSDGMVLMNPKYKALKEDLILFEENDWKILDVPPAATDAISPVALCSLSLSANLLSISPKCCIIEECEVPMYHFLEDQGFDVITCPLRTLNEFGGGVHCVTWDIRRDDTCKDYFPNQTECPKGSSCITS